MKKIVIDLARRGVGHYRRATDRKARQVPRFGVGAPTATGPTVYYLAPDNDRPSGGVRVIYRHVDLLGELGIRAAVVHEKAGFRCSWFANETPVVTAAAVVPGRADVLVVPEWYGPAMGQVPREPRLVVFNQRAYDTFDSVPYDGTAPGAPYSEPHPVALLAVSDDNVELLRYAFPRIPVHLTRNVIDDRIFFPSSAPRRRLLSYVPHRRHAEREQLLHILRSRGVLRGWDLTAISGRTEEETAAIMRDSAVFLSLSEREGFGLPPAEAMACGSYVVGYPGLAGREFLDPAYSAPVADGDLLALARAVEDACATFDSDPAVPAKKGAEASRQVLSRYSADNLRADLTAFYGPLLPLRRVS
ncbi:glycosyltransferase [Paractinoplanes maris]|uniref:glycosyltransferase n=1 Tax=Paractinoplanes maris TaxID=1734446 RepID=UPI0020200D3C|nr:glycosyltransferase [Actinoplanes maris]